MNQTGPRDVVHAHGFGFSYGSKSILKDVNVKVSGQGIHALIGPSGCGKSTFLLSVADLLPRSRRKSAEGESITTEGSLMVSPECDERPGSRLKAIGYVFQQPLPFRMSIYDNVALALKEHGLPRNDIADRVHVALQEAGLWDEVSHKLKEPALALSGGQQQRLCLARTLALNPCLLLLDEPCSALDPLATAAIEERIQVLGRKHCVLLVTHNLAQARRIADKVSLFWSVQGQGGGTCLETETAEEFFLQPKTPLGQRYLEAEWGKGHAGARRH